MENLEFITASEARKRSEENLPAALELASLKAKQIIIDEIESAISEGKTEANCSIKTIDDSILVFSRHKNIATVSLPSQNFFSLVEALQTLGYNARICSNGHLEFLAIDW